jgi:hypothetical protein
VDILYYLDNFTPEFLVIETALLIILLTFLIFLWLYNRKRFQALKHQIPAGVVKSYLDSIIQNSDALKSSLFRGGGLDIDKNSIPSVMPVSNLPGGDSIEISTAAGSSEDLSKKNAELAALQAQLVEKINLIKELEDRLANMPTGVPAEVDETQLNNLKDELDKANKEIEELKNQPAPEAAGGVAEDEFNKVKGERDDLLEKLKEYEVIEDDLANLKRLKQENEQLKKSLGDGGEEAVTVEGGEPEAEETTLVSGGSEGEEEVTVVSGGEDSGEDLTVVGGGEDEALNAPAPTDEPVLEAAPEESALPEGDDEKKTPEDLLSEFEKMLG